MDDNAGKNILKEEPDIGHSVRNKRTNISFRNKKKACKPKEEWYRVENTHETVVSEDVFRQVQEQMAEEWHTQIFSGLVKCADCGWSLAYGGNSQKKSLCTLPLQQVRAALTSLFPLYPLRCALRLCPLCWSVLARQGEDGNREREVAIFYRFIGKNK